jgi:putative DNA primase/helicase
MGPERDWTDTDTARALLWFQRVALLGPAEKSHVDAAVSLIAQDSPRNCMADWLTAITWDEVPRLVDLLPVGFGAKRTPYTEAVGRCFAVSLIARVIRPGCKVDTMPVFEGSQGIGKSTALAILGGEFFAESHEQIGTKDFNLSLEGRWLMELSELHSMSASEVERVKAVLSTATDRFRSPYDRHFKESPRQVVFAGTTNRDDWHQDPTGGRRFWPVRCGTVDLVWLATNRDQIFAEALAQYHAGRDWYSVPADDAAGEIAQRRNEDSWEDILRCSLVESRIYSSADVLGGPLGIEAGKQTPKDARRLSGIMVALGWERVGIRTHDGFRRGYRHVSHGITSCITPK